MDINSLNTNIKKVTQDEKYLPITKKKSNIFLVTYQIFYPQTQRCTVVKK